MSHPRKHTWDQVYLEEYGKGKALFWGQTPDRFVIWIAENLKEKGMSQSVILDAGCGEGRNSVYLAKQGFKVWGIDIASSAIEKGKKWVTSEGLMHMVNLTVGNITALPCKDNSFDIVVDIFTTEFISRKERYVDEVARALKYGGLFFIRTHKSPLKPGLKLGALEKMLEKNFKLLKVDKPSNATLNLVAEKKS